MNPHGLHTFTVGTIAGNAVIPAGSRVKLTGGLLQPANAADGRGVEVGTVEMACTTGYAVAVRARTFTGSRNMIASGVIAANAEVFSDANGKVSATRGAGAKSWGIALKAAAADGDVIPVLTDPE